MLNDKMNLIPMRVQLLDKRINGNKNIQWYL